MSPLPQQLVVIGGGMVAQRLVEALRARDEAGRWHVTVLAEEPRAPYDRVALTSYFSGRDPESLSLGSPDLWDDPCVTLVRGRAATTLDLAARTVRSDDGTVRRYDRLVLATGSRPTVPPIVGADLPGVFVYRTIDDVAALRGWVEERSARHDRPVRGAVIGGGLLGLEAAGALQALGTRTTVVQVGTHLMSAQIDLGGGHVLRRLIGRLGVDVRVDTATSRIRADDRGRVTRLDLTDGGRIDVDVVVLDADHDQAVVAAQVVVLEGLAGAAGVVHQHDVEAVAVQVGEGAVERALRVGRQRVGLVVHARPGRGRRQDGEQARGEHQGSLQGCFLRGWDRAHYPARRARLQAV